MTFSTLFRNAQIATMTTGKSYGLIENGAVVISADRIKWVGAEKNCRMNLRDFREKI